MSIREIDYEHDITLIKDIWLKHHNSNKEQKWEDVDGEIKCSKNKTYVKIMNSSIVAFVTIRIGSIKGANNLQNYIFEIFAYPTQKGFGSELIREMQEQRQFLSLHVKKSNINAIGCYKRNGFKIKGKNADNSKYRMEWRKRSLLRE